MLTNIVQALALAAPLTTTLLGAVTLVCPSFGYSPIVPNLISFYFYRTPTVSPLRRGTLLPTDDPTSTLVLPLPKKLGDPTARNSDDEQMARLARSAAPMQPLSPRTLHPPSHQTDGPSLPALKPGMLHPLFRPRQRRLLRPTRLQHRRLRRIPLLSPRLRVPAATTGHSVWLGPTVIGMDRDSLVTWDNTHRAPNGKHLFG
jgi:hypothetical protein